MKVMPPHTIEGDSELPACKGATERGYVFVLDNGHLHCNYCGWVCLPRPLVTCAHGVDINGTCEACAHEVYCETCEGCHLPGPCTPLTSA